MKDRKDEAYQAIAKYMATNIKVKSERDINKERLSELKVKKNKYAKEVCELKKELGIKPNWKGKVLPNDVRGHAKCKYFMKLRSKLTQIDSEITQLYKNGVEKQDYSSFESDFVKIVKEEYPDIFKDVKSMILNNKK